MVPQTVSGPLPLGLAPSERPVLQRRRNSDTGQQRRLPRRSNARRRRDDGRIALGSQRRVPLVTRCRPHATARVYGKEIGTQSSSSLLWSPETAQSTL